MTSPSKPFVTIPHHVAIIMDGNGRWAQAQGYGRTRGHIEGGRRVYDIIFEAHRLGVKYLTLYTFSTENWNRPLSEVAMLMRYLAEQLRTFDKTLRKERVKFIVQGDVERLPKFARREIERVSRLTDFEDPALTLLVALSYGGRKEITDACQKIAVKAKAGEIDPAEIDEEMFRAHLYQPLVPDPDLLIRTGGESRVSNFLLWQIAYSELYLTPTLWPDFGPQGLRDAVEYFGMRQRRFGKTSEQILEESGASAAPTL